MLPLTQVPQINTMYLAAMAHAEVLGLTSVWLDVSLTRLLNCGLLLAVT